LTAPLAAAIVAAESVEACQDPEGAEALDGGSPVGLVWHADRNRQSDKIRKIMLGIERCKGELRFYAIFSRRHQ
jgi:hypothetical protein